MDSCDACTTTHGESELSESSSSMFTFHNLECQISWFILISSLNLTLTLMQ